MDLKDAERLALELMGKHGLLDAGWTFVYGNAERRLACCHYRKKLIRASRHMTGAADPEFFTQVMLHEIAHALLPPVDPSTGKTVGHGPLWKAKAREIGYTAGTKVQNPYQRPLSEQAAKALEGAKPGTLRVGQLGIVLPPSRNAGELFLVSQVNPTTYTGKLMTSGRRVRAKKFIIGVRPGANATIL